jgi:tetratricopeptide (TPR) repeat protein
MNILVPSSYAQMPVGVAAAPLAPLQDCGESPLPLEASEFEELIAQLRAKAETPESLFEQAKTLADQEHHEEAVGIFTKILQLKPDFQPAVASRGYSYFELGQLDASLQDAEQSLKLTPNAKTYFARGVVYFEQGQYERALEDYKKSESLNAGDRCTHNNLGLTYEMLGQPEPALTHYNRALQIDPKFDKALRNRAIFHLYQGSYWNAVSDTARLWWLSLTS